MKIIAIGDPHFKVDNIPEVDEFISKLEDLVQKVKPDLIVVLGDVLHDHEKLHTVPMNKACEMFKMLRKYAFTYVIVGNHDMCDHLQFLTEMHWMNVLKDWDRIKVVDKVEGYHKDGFLFYFAPYVHPGRFKEALNTTGESWKKAQCIFAHQEFYGCKMGAFDSEEGDKWELDLPNVVTGHIHLNQQLQSNVYYPGSAMQNTSAENGKNIIAEINISKDGSYVLTEHDLGLRRRRTVYMDINDVSSFDSVKDNTDDKLKLTISGDHEEFKLFKKSDKYKELVKEGVNVVFKSKKSEVKMKTENLLQVIDDTNKEEITFKEIVSRLVEKEKDAYLTSAYERVLNDNIVNEDDIFFL